MARPDRARFGYVVTPNADHLVRLARAPEWRPAYTHATLRLLDSRVVAGAARLFALAPPPVVPGSDLVAALLARPEAAESVTLLGLPDSWLGALARRTGLVPRAHWNPPMGLLDDPAAFAAALDFLEAHPARFTLLAIGSPAQEVLAAALSARGRARGLGLCVGAALDFLSGRSRRAPVWMRRAGLEWLHRLAREPRRLGARYLREDPALFALLARERFGYALSWNTGGPSSLKRNRS
ncbi:MAG: WecB/TagA/CpsF family glycosyltransferase [Rhodospirillales bacterium]|nr:WecB/TagA/CpsF family glycosyltransferase [Rhodospirillales bacterium]